MTMTKSQNTLALARSVVQLHQIIKSFQDLPPDNDSEENKPSILDSQTLQQLEKIATTMQSNLNLTTRPVPHSLSFHSLTLESLELMGINYESHLILKDTNIYTRITLSAAKGENELWTSEFLHRHINMLKGFVAKNEAGARMWIDAFFYRVKAMLQDPDKSMILSLEKRVDVDINPSTNLCGVVDYTIIKAEHDVAEFLLDFPKLGIHNNKENLVFLVTESKDHQVNLEEYLPQAIGGMYAYATALERKVVRGAVTDGRNWIFVMYKSNEEAGGCYLYSRRVTLFPDIHGEISKEYCDLVAGILTHWIEHSNQDLDDDDWFETSKASRTTA